MANTPENLALARELAAKAPDTGKRGKSKTNVLKEQLRQEFMEVMGSEFFNILQALKKKVETGDTRAILALLEQLIGKAEEEVQHKGNLGITFNGTGFYIHSSQNSDGGDESTQEIQGDSVREEMGQDNTGDQPTNL